MVKRASMSRRDRAKTRDIQSRKDSAARAYRNKVLAGQAEKLLGELEKTRAQEAESADGVIRQKVVKRKSTRIAYRSVGIVFVLVGVLFMWWAAGGGMRFLKAAVAVAALMYGFYLVRASFRKTAYDHTFLFGSESVTVLIRKGSVVIPYGQIKNEAMITPDPDMEYYIIKFDSGRDSYVIPFGGMKKKCEAVYELLRDKCPDDET